MGIIVWEIITRKKSIHMQYRHILFSLIFLIHDWWNPEPGLYFSFLKLLHDILLQVGKNLKSSPCPIKAGPKSWLFLYTCLPFYVLSTTFQLYLCFKNGPETHIAFPHCYYYSLCTCSLLYLESFSSLWLLSCHLSLT
jgi:hypothetical protein